MLTSQELDDARSDAAETLVDSAIVKRATPTNSYGIVEETWASVGTVACRLDPETRSADPNAAEREAARAYFTLTLPYNASIIDGDKVTINSDDYEVVRLHRQHSYRLMVRAQVFRIEE